MNKYSRTIILLMCINSVCICLFGQYRFKPANDSCYCNDIFIMGLRHFDTLTSVSPPKSYRFYDKSQDFKAANRSYSYATEKRNVHELICMRKDQYLYSLFNEDVYVVAHWPYSFYKYIVQYCATDTLKEMIAQQMSKYVLAYKYIGDAYSIKKFSCIDYRQQLFLVVLMNVDFYNRAVEGFCPAAYLLSEFDTNITKGLYVKVLLPFYDD